MPQYTNYIYIHAFIGFAVAALLLGFAQGALITVEAGESLQAAIDAASPGDVLEVKSGIYRENLNITKQLTLQGWALAAESPWWMRAGWGMP
jgi:nitrous oxidase accessory protein NosD